MKTANANTDAKVEELNTIFDRLKDRCTGHFHNALWQIMINGSCSGAFTYIYSEASVGVALPSGHYVSCDFDVLDPDDRNEVLNELNWAVFGLDDRQAVQLVGQSIFAVHL